MLWRQVGDDLDNAVAEFGQFVEAKLDERVNEIVEQWRERVADAAHRHRQSKSQARFRPESLDRGRLREAYDEVLSYYVRGKVRRYYGDPQNERRILIWEKDATFDPEIDMDWSKGDVTITSQEAL